MGSQSNIQWTDATWNPVVGCSKVSEGCRHCYAMTMAARIANAARATVGIGGRGTERQAGYALALQWAGDKALPQWSNQVLTLPGALTEPLHWRKPRRVFVNSMSDLFHDDVPFQFIDQVFAVMALCPQHTFQVLTKRPERMAEYMQRCCKDAIASWPTDAGGRIHRHPWIVAGRELAKGRGSKLMNDAAVVAVPSPNVWLGTSAEDQATLDERVPHLLRCPAAVRFLSLEPLLGPMDIGLLDQRLHDDPKCDHSDVIECRSLPARRRDQLGWVIVGGESGSKARACDMAWIENIINQCRAAHVPVFVKQLGAFPFLRGKAMTASDGGTAFDSSMPVTLDIRHSKGGRWDEWPEHLRVREWPRQSEI